MAKRTTRSTKGKRSGKTASRARPRKGAGASKAGNGEARNVAERELFVRLVAEAPTIEDAWRQVRKAFPRERWGKVRDITQALTDHKTFTGAFKAAHDGKALHRTAVEVKATKRKTLTKKKKAKAER